MVTRELIPGFKDMHGITVELRPTFRTPASPERRTTPVETIPAGQGRFTFNNVPIGSYVLYIHRPGYLVRAMNVVISATDPAIVELRPPGAEDNGVFNLWWGDCNGDMRVDNEDIIMVIYYMDIRANLGDPRYNPACDLNADGRADNEDILMVQDKWNRNVMQYAGAGDVNFYS
jgi:hypothetical protein